MIAIKERLDELSKQYKEMTDSKLQTRDITQEFVLRSKLRDLHNACKVLFVTLFIFIFHCEILFFIFIMNLSGMGSTC